MDPREREERPSADMRKAAESGSGSHSCPARGIGLSPEDHADPMQNFRQESSLI